MSEPFFGDQRGEGGGCDGEVIIGEGQCAGCNRSETHSREDISTISELEEEKLEDEWEIRKLSRKKSDQIYES